MASFNTIRFIYRESVTPDYDLCRADNGRFYVTKTGKLSIVRTFASYTDALAYLRPNPRPLPNLATLG